MTNLIQARKYHCSGRFLSKKVAFVLDNAKIHKTKKNFNLLTNKYNFLFLSPYSAPMMPIEFSKLQFPKFIFLAFGYLKKKVFQIVRKTRRKLITAISEEIHNLPMNICNRYIDHSLNVFEKAWNMEDLIN